MRLSHRHIKSIYLEPERKPLYTKHSIYHLSLPARDSMPSWELLASPPVSVQIAGMPPASTRIPFAALATAAMATLNSVGPMLILATPSSASSLTVGPPLYADSNTATRPSSSLTSVCTLSRLSPPLPPPQ